MEKTLIVLGAIAALTGSAVADDKETLCKQLSISDEIDGAEGAFMLARRYVFGCGGTNSLTRIPPAPMSPLVAWLDSSAQEPDEIVRLAYVSLEAHGIAMARNEREELSLLPPYVIAQYDLKAFNADKVKALLDQPPYKGNAYAKETVDGVLAKLKTEMENVDERVKNKTTDADWKEVLITAPQRGIDAWNAAAAKYKTELQHSADFEQAAFGPSLKAIKGCQAILGKDLQPILKAVKHETEGQLIEGLNANPVAGLLLKRYQACTVYDGNEGAAMAMLMNVKGVRVTRGPRQAAYYAAVEALNKIMDDRPKFQIEARNIGLDFKSQGILDDLTRDLLHKKKKEQMDSFGLDFESGVVKTAKTVKDVVKVTFVTDKQERYLQSCKQTNHIITFEADGKPVYDQNCTGHVEKVDVSSNPIEIPKELAAEVTPGKFIEFITMDEHERRSLARRVFSDKKGKNLVAWYGISLK